MVSWQYCTSRRETITGEVTRTEAPGIDDADACADVLSPRMRPVGRALTTSVRLCRRARHKAPQNLQASFTMYASEQPHCAIRGISSLSVPRELA